MDPREASLKVLESVGLTQRQQMALDWLNLQRLHGLYDVRSNSSTPVFQGNRDSPIGLEIPSGRRSHPLMDPPRHSLSSMYTPPYDHPLEAPPGSHHVPGSNYRRDFEAPRPTHRLSSSYSSTESITLAYDTLAELEVIQDPRRATFGKKALDDSDLYKRHEIDFDVKNPPEEEVKLPGTDLVESLEEHDVVCGRGASANKNAGNISYRDLIRDFRRTYVASNRKTKNNIARSIVIIIRRRGGRFLAQAREEDRSGYVDIGDVEAHKKTMQTMRDSFFIPTPKKTTPKRAMPRLMSPVSPITVSRKKAKTTHSPTHQSDSAMEHAPLTPHNPPSITDTSMSSDSFSPQRQLSPP